MNDIVDQSKIPFPFSHVLHCCVSEEQMQEILRPQKKLNASKVLKGCFVLNTFNGDILMMCNPFLPKGFPIDE